MNKEKVLFLLSEEYTALSQLERCTEALLEAPTDDFDDLLKERGSYLNRAVSAESHLKKLRAADEELCNVLSGNAMLSSLAPDMKEIFEASLRVKATLCRIGHLDTPVLTRMENERADALNHIEEINRSSGSIAGSYGAAVRTAMTNQALSSNGMTV